jgi:hypothetical protein
VGWRTPVDPVPDETLLLAHTPAHLARLGEPRDFDADTAYSPTSVCMPAARWRPPSHATRHARSPGRPAFALMRPPGHHATAEPGHGLLLPEPGRGRRAFGPRDSDIGGSRSGTSTPTTATEPRRSSSARRDSSSAPSTSRPGYPGTGLGTTSAMPQLADPPRTRPGSSTWMRCARRSTRSSGSGPNSSWSPAGFDAYAGDPITEMTLEARISGRSGAGSRRRDSRGGVLEGGYSADLPELVGEFLEAWSE